MHLTTRRAALAAVAGLAFLSLFISPAQAMQRTTGAATVLRYHFAVGQTYSYLVTSSMQMGQGAGRLLLLLGGNLPPGLAGTTEMTGTVHFRVVRVDASGGADVEMSTGPVTTTTVDAGTPTTTVKGPLAPSRVHIGADGRANGTVGFNVEGVGLAVLGTLPSGSVAPGAHWNTAAAFQLPAAEALGLAPVQVSVRNDFTKIVTAGHQRAASIDGQGAPQYSTDLSMNDGSTLHVSVSGTLATHSLFGLATHRLISSHVVSDLTILLGKRHRIFGGRGIPEHLVIDVSPSA